ncbi:MAG: pilus assembly protein [Betaproteobacteria bacterium]|nr:pilus assembly protein [Betaproteobacteria bacterium]
MTPLHTHRIYPLNYPFESLAAHARRQGYRADSGGRARGFTVIELMMAIIILAIIVALGAPGLFSFITQSRMTGQINDLLADLSYARSEAATRGVRVGVCAVTVGTTACATGAGADWAVGRMVYVDTNGDGVRDTATSSTELVLRTTAALTGGSVLTVTQSGAGTHPSSFQFRPYGGIATAGNQSIPGAAAGTQIGFTLCPASGTASNKQGRQIDISLTGRPVVSKVNC